MSSCTWMVAVITLICYSRDGYSLTDISCPNGTIAAFDFGDKLEKTECVNKHSPRIFGYRMSLYLVGYHIEGNCDNYFVGQYWHLCDTQVEKPFIKLANGQTLHLEHGQKLYFGDTNDKQYVDDWQKCIVVTDQASPCPAFAVQRIFEREHNNDTGTSSEELKMMLDNKFEFYDPSFWDSDTTRWMELRQPRHTYLGLPKMRYHHFGHEKTGCHSECNKIGVEYVVEFVFILTPKEAAVNKFAMIHEKSAEDTLTKPKETAV